MLISHVPKLLKDYNLTAYGLAMQSGIKQDQARKLRSGALPTTFQIEAICRALDIQPGEVVEFVDSEPAQHG